MNIENFALKDAAELAAISIANNYERSRIKVSSCVSLMLPFASAKPI